MFGPTETIILADDGANADFCAADLIAQAEHDPLATAILVTNSEDLIARVENRLESQLATALRGEVARQALERQGRVVLVDSLDEGVDLVNRIAPNTSACCCRTRGVGSTASITRAASSWASTLPRSWATT